MKFKHPKEVMRAAIFGLKPNCYACKSFHKSTNSWCYRHKQFGDTPRFSKDALYVCTDFKLKKQP